MYSLYNEIVGVRKKHKYLLREFYETTSINH